MENLERKIKNKLQGATSTHGVDADALWLDIEKEIRGKEKKVISLYPRLLLLATSLFLLLFGFFWFYSMPSDLQRDFVETRSEVMNDENKSNVGTDKASFLCIEGNHKKSSVLLDTNKEEEGSDLAIEEVVFPNENKLEAKSGIENELKEAAKEVEQKEFVVFDENQNHQKIDELEIINAIDKINVLQPISRKVFYLTMEDEEIVRREDLLSDNTVASDLDRLSLSGFVGSHIIQNNFKGGGISSEERQSLLKNGFQQELGYSLAVEAKYKFTESFHIKSGLEYFQSTEEFNYNRQWDTVMWENNIPNSRLINALGARTVKHHNKYSFFSVPIMVGVEKEAGKFGYGIQFGLGLNFVISQSGRSINRNDQLVNFSDAGDETLPRPSFYLSYQVQPYLQYKANEHLAWQVRLDIRQQNFGDSKFYDLQYSSLLTGCNVGLVFTP